MRYHPVCIEHNIRLNSDGTCPQCRDVQGQPFILDMQGYFLKMDFPMIEKAIAHFMQTAGGNTPLDILELQTEIEILRNLKLPSAQSGT